MDVKYPAELLNEVKPMISIQLDEAQVEEIFKAELKKRLAEIEENLTFWDAKELQRQTNMSINTIKDKFFYDDRFPKYRVGSKWYFPAKECQAFLLEWLKEQDQF